jgi:hypothetical protein
MTDNSEVKLMQTLTDVARTAQVLRDELEIACNKELYAERWWRLKRMVVDDAFANSIRPQGNDIDEYQEVIRMAIAQAEALYPEPIHAATEAE